MGSRILPVVAAVVLAAGCAEPEREWLKLDQHYTAEEFRQDLDACTRAGQLDEECMKTRGWVSVTPKAEKAPEPIPPRGRPRQ